MTWKNLHFRVTEEVANEFSRTAYAIEGPGHGALVAFFRRMWEDHGAEYMERAKVDVEIRDS